MSMKTISRELRKRQTPSEQRLWYYLRNHRLDGHSFRRQQPIGPYIVDFLCPARKLIVEVDGAIHDLPDHRGNDAVRQNFLEASGYRVIRFTNATVNEQITDVLQQIRCALQQ
ncbi:MAG: endonuclease domain-containing protein [Candidatus Melainabacteria bacterium]